MKKIYLIANAHIDPIWQWELDEGLNCTVATFESALNLLDEYDYLFCHNEALLYQYIERNRPDLFERIKTKIREGKWRVMGGWYLQPDCRLPQAESLVRQIRYGLRYFSRFGDRPRVAVNADSFGHSKGLVQILVKTGFTGYLFQRPQPCELKLPAEKFIWEGFGGYRIKAVRISDGYNSPLGKAMEKIREEIRVQEADDSVLVLWGVGNHGGGPSRRDLEEIARFSEDNEEYEVAHASPEDYFDALNTDAVFSGSLDQTMLGCLTSQARLKQAHRELENLLYSTEKMLSAAYLQTGYPYCGDETDRAAEALMLTEFHDVLPGTSIRDGEKSALDLIGYGKCELRRLRSAALNALSMNLTPTKAGEYSVVAFNPHPYEYTLPLQFEIMLADQNRGETIKNFDVFVGGKKAPSQLIKERSNVALDWRKRLAITCALPPCGAEQIVLREREEKSPRVFGRSADGYLFDNGRLQAVFGPTGFIETVTCETGCAVRGPIRPVVFTDTADSWAMQEKQRGRIGNRLGGGFRLMTEEESAEFSGTGSPLPPLRAIEDGDVLVKIEGMYRFGAHTACCGYTFYRDFSYFDINIRLFFNGADQCVKLDFPMCASAAETEVPYGREEIPADGAEHVCGQFVSIGDAAVVPVGIGGCSFEDGHLYLNLVRGAGYATHPFCEREYVPQDRFVERMDQGVTEFSVRIFPHADYAAIPRLAQAFHETPYAVELSVSSRAKQTAWKSVRLSNPDILLTAHRRSQDRPGKMVARLLNNGKNGAETALFRGEKEIARLCFEPFEVKTVLYDENGAEESFELLI